MAQEGPAEGEVGDESHSDISPTPYSGIAQERKIPLTSQQRVKRVDSTGGAYPLALW